MNIDSITSNYVPLIQTAIMVLGLYSILLVKRQINESTHWNRVNAAYALLHSQCLHDRKKNMIDALEKIKISLNHNHEISDEDVVTIFKDTPAYTATMDYLNYVERVCAGISYEAFDESLLYEFYSESFMLTYTQFREFIRKYRHEHNDDEEFFIELEKISDKWKRDSEERMERSKYSLKKLKCRLGICPRNK